jgi:hypothetical protein
MNDDCDFPQRNELEKGFPDKREAFTFLLANKQFSCPGFAFVAEDGSHIKDL